MALVICPECSKEVSNSAPACPNCGVAIALKSEQKAAGARLTTIQGTSKKLKGQTLASVFAIIIGVVWVVGIMGSAPGDTEPSGIPFFLIIGGFVWFVVTKIRIWWHHK